ncbi:hypothetical protein [Paraburkholderia sp. J67]|uniref:hypothetical protein n=1 Tax=Paraburkholderia sp. J67 TaxID=2805435 RepID=UPI002ABDDFD2|nr:hypothetical protein [Paraburkholderia sp. J67]
MATSATIKTAAVVSAAFLRVNFMGSNALIWILVFSGTRTPPCARVAVYLPYIALIPGDRLFPAGTNTTLKAVLAA